MRKPDTALLTALLVAGSGFMELLDTTVITTAIPRMAQSFGVHPIDLNLGVTAYMIMLAAGIPLSGWAAERFGARTVFASAILIFTVASALCGLSNGLWEFFAARILQGLGGAMMVPVGRLVVLRVTPKPQLMQATALITWPALVAPILGPVVGGFLTTYASWRWIFFLNVPIGLVGLIATLLIIRNGQNRSAKRLDVPGAILSGLAAVAFVYGASLAGTNSGSLRWSLGLMLLGIIGGWATVVHAKRVKTPLIEFSAFAIQTFRATLRGGSLVRMGINAAPFLLPLMFQLGFHRSPVAAGSLLLVLFVGNLAIKPLTTPMMRRFGFRTVLIINGVILALTFLGFALIDASTPAWLLMPLLLVSGMARSTEFTAMNTLAYADVPPERMGSANILFNLGQQVAFGLGVAVGAILLRIGQGVLGGHQITVADFHFAFVCTFLLCLMGVADFLALPAQAGANVSGHTAKGLASRN
ncbi:DHA2 family efflux MFS transporter permease subunit [Acidisoma cellulosilytica]|uniref:DHA2 family efflux MFS transporter permease subunit n=1 Tax=Acidisoma cellulosilyticum TaxID=2802395 RepID=A0A964E3D9_9PROT|nr:DHA2 family efflux MFS transporter permease subunit [Acidisoma cellulosilyticum]MCB8880605.1 DHA2 family efflux MFS transporter permease subunit [Acidisoma cellulosilyticum]